MKPRFSILAILSLALLSCKQPGGQGGASEANETAASAAGEPKIGDCAGLPPLAAQVPEAKLEDFVTGKEGGYDLVSAVHYLRLAEGDAHASSARVRVFLAPARQAVTDRPEVECLYMPEIQDMQIDVTLPKALARSDGAYLHDGTLSVQFKDGRVQAAAKVELLEVEKGTRPVFGLKDVKAANAADSTQTHLYRVGEQEFELRIAIHRESEKDHKKSVLDSETAFRFKFNPKVELAPPSKENP